MFHITEKYIVELSLHGSIRSFIVSSINIVNWLKSKYVIMIVRAIFILEPFLTHILQNTCVIYELVKRFYDVILGFFQPSIDCLSCIKGLFG